MNRKLERYALLALQRETEDLLEALCLSKRDAKRRLQEIHNRLEAIRNEEKEAA